MAKSGFHVDELFGIPTKLAMDPVHGGIHFFPHESDVMGHPLFQRLRFVAQTDVTSYVFPGSTHTRLQHSLGTMHVAGELFKSVIRAYLNEAKKRHRTLLSQSQVESIRYVYYCFRLAGLLHDIGHFPFSHLFEGTVAGKSLLQQEGTFEEIWKGIDWINFYDKAAKSIGHEEYSVRCAYEVLSSLKATSLGVEVIDVLGMMGGTKCKPSGKFNSATSDILSIIADDLITDQPHNEEMAENFQRFFKVLISGEFDVDKMDYLLRDSFYSGCHYGIYNLDHLLSTIRIGFINNPAWVGIAITEKGIAHLEDFAYSRFRLYQQVYSHKIVCGFKYLSLQSIDDIYQNDNLKSEIDSLLLNINKFSNFTDSYLWEKIRLHAESKPNSSAAHLLQRKKLKWLLSIKNASHVARRIKETEIVQHGLANKCIYYESPITFSRVQEKSFSDIQVLVVDPYTRKRSLNQINQVTNFFDKFGDVSMTHFYENPF